MSLREALEVRVSCAPTPESDTELEILMPHRLWRFRALNAKLRDQWVAALQEEARRRSSTSSTQMNLVGNAFGEASSKALAEAAEGRDIDVQL